MARRDLLGLLGFLAACLALGLVRLHSALRNAAHWYETMERPDFAAPPGMIGLFWTLLYMMIGLAGWLVWREGGFAHARPVLAYGTQLVLNLATSFLYFDADRLQWLLPCAVLLTLAVLWNLWEFWRIERIAAVLLVPYLAWMSFTTLLNVLIWRMN
jgi:tryptophan-rich sensory protein